MVGIAVKPRHNRIAGTPLWSQPGDQSSESKEVGCDMIQRIGFPHLLDHIRKQMLW